MSEESSSASGGTSDETEREIAAWRATRERVAALVGTMSPEELRRSVPACPDWRVTDLLAHMVGLAADVLDGDEPDDHNEAWTQAQVDARADRSAADLLAEWGDLAPRLEEWMRTGGTRPLNDVVIHEQDLRGVAGVPGGRDSDGFAIVRERMAAKVGGLVRDAGLAPIALVAPDWSWCSSGPIDEASVRLEADGYDLGRALTTRRTAEQLRSWVVAGDVTAYLGAFAHLGELPTAPLPE